MDARTRSRGAAEEPSLSSRTPRPVKIATVGSLLAVNALLLAKIGETLADTRPEFPPLNSDQVALVVSQGPKAEEICESSESGPSDLDAWLPKRKRAFNDLDLVDLSSQWCRGTGMRGAFELSVNQIAFAEGALSPTWRLTDVEDRGEYSLARFTADPLMGPEVSHWESFKPVTKIIAKADSN